MKGFTEVTVEKALLALETRNKRKDVAVEIRERATELYASEWRRKANFYQKWKKKDMTDGQLLFSNYDMWANFAQILNPYIEDEEEFQLLSQHERNSYYREGTTLRQLVNASTSGILLIDGELCEFINKFTMADEDES